MAADILTTEVLTECWKRVANAKCGRSQDLGSGEECDDILFDVYRQLACKPEYKKAMEVVYTIHSQECKQGSFASSSSCPCPDRHTPKISRDLIDRVAATPGRKDLVVARSDSTTFEVRE